jgi:four helix bundle protein
MQNNKNIRDLAERTKTFALLIIKIYTGLPHKTVTQVIGKQVLRSGTSVGANYREANRARSKAEFVAKMGDCLKELDETSYWLELTVESAIVDKPNLLMLLEETNQLIAIFVTIINKAKKYK